MASKKRYGIRKGKASRKVYQEIQEQLEVNEYVQKVLDDIDYEKSIRRYIKEIQYVLVEIRKKLKDHLQKSPEILNSNVDIQEQLYNIQKELINQLNYIRRINTERLEEESQEQLIDLKEIIRKMLCTISTSVKPRKKERNRELNPPDLVCKTSSSSQQQIQTSNENRDVNLKQNYNAINIEKWMILSFSTTSCCNRNRLKKFAKKLRQAGEKIGMKLADPLLIKYFTKSYECVEDFVKEAKEIEPNLQIAVIVLPTKGLHEIYTKVKTVAETELGLVVPFVKDYNVPKIEMS